MRLSFLLVFLAGLFSACEPKPACGPSNCTGCCKGDVCELGSAPNACGVAANTCDVCILGQICQLGRCQSLPGPQGGGGGGGGGGSPTGGGGGSPTGGGGPSCASIASIPASATYSGGRYIAQDGGWSVFEAKVKSPTSAGSTTDYATAERWYLAKNGTPTFPANGVQLPLTTFAECTDCLTYQQGCVTASDRTSCSKTFLAQSGTVSWATGTGNAAAGQLSGSASGVRFEEWNFSTDTRVDGGSCVIVDQLGFAATWPSANDSCMGVPASGRCASATQVEFCSTATGNGASSVQTYSCPAGTTCTVADAGFQSFANCSATGACVPGTTRCQSTSTLQTCTGGNWVSSNCPSGCATSGLASACRPSVTTTSYTGTLNYQTRGPNSAFTDWNTTSFDAPAQGLTVWSFSQGQLIDAAKTNSTGGYTVLIPSAPVAGDYVAFVALAGSSDGGIAYMIANPNVSAGVTDIYVSKPMPRAWAWTADSTTLTPGSTLRITEAAGSGAMRIFDYMRYVHAQAASKNGGNQGLSLIAWLGLETSWTCGACASRIPTTAFGYQFESQIWFNGSTTDQEYWSDAVTAHELGHWAMSSYGVSPGEGGRHCLGWPSPPGLAWSEGWATWHSSWARRDPRYYDKQGGSMFWFDIDDRAYSSMTTWRRPIASAGLLQDLDENELAAMLWSMSSSTATADNSLWTALASPRMTTRMRQAYAGTATNLRGYTRHHWASACPIAGRVDDGLAAPALPDFLDALNCGGFSRATIDAATNPSVNYPYPTASPLCQ